MVAHQSHATDFEPGGLVSQFRNNHEAIHLCRQRQVVLIPQFQKIAAAFAQAQRFMDDHAMMFETIPSDAGTVAKWPIGLMQHIDERPRQQRVFERDLAVSTRTKQVDGPLFTQQLFADAAEIDEARHHDARRLGGMQQGMGAVGGGHHEGLVFAHVASEVRGRIAELKARDGFAAAFTAEQTAFALAVQLLGQLLSRFDGRHGPHSRATRGQGMDDRRARAEDINHHRHAAAQRFGVHQLGQQMHKNGIGHEGTFSLAKPGDIRCYYPQLSTDIKCTKRQVGRREQAALGSERWNGYNRSMHTLPLMDQLTQPVLGGQDFRQFYAGAKLLGQGQNPYDPHLVYELQKLDYFNQVHVSVSPPTSFVPYLPFSVLPYKQAMHAHAGFSILLLCLSVFAWGRWLFPQQRWVGWCMPLVLLLWPPVYLLISLGQISAIVLAGFTGWLWAMQTGWPALAGASLVLCAMKPHLGLVLILFALGYALHKKQWRMLTAFALVSIGVLTIPWLLRPTAYSEWRDWLRETPLTIWFTATLQFWLRFNLNEAWIDIGWWLWGAGMAAAFLWGLAGIGKRYPLAYHAILVLTLNLAVAMHAFTYDYVLLLPGFVFGCGLWLTQRKHVALLWLVLALLFVYARLNLMREWELWTVAWLAGPVSLWLFSLSAHNKNLTPAPAAVH